MGRDDAVIASPSERRINLWVTALASLLAAVLGSGVGGYFSYRASEHVSRDQATQSQLDFVRQQRQTAYLQAASLIAALQAATKKAIYDSLPYGAGITGDPSSPHVDRSPGPWTNSITALRTTFPAFEAAEQPVAALSATIAIVGSSEGGNEFHSLISMYSRIDGDLYDAAQQLSALPNALTQQQVLTVGKEFDDENDTERKAEVLATQFEATARADLKILR